MSDKPRESCSSCPSLGRCTRGPRSCPLRPPGRSLGTLARSGSGPGRRGGSGRPCGPAHHSWSRAVLGTQRPWSSGQVGDVRTAPGTAAPVRKHPKACGSFVPKAVERLRICGKFPQWEAPQRQERAKGHPSNTLTLGAWGLLPHPIPQLQVVCGPLRISPRG